MHTHCPQCSTAFAVTEAQLSAANGKVRCGQCSTVFDAKEHPFEPLATPAPPPVLHANIPTQSEPEPENATEEVPEILRRAQPKRISPLWGLGALLLAGLAAAQVGWFGRDYWIQIPEGRQALEKACKYVQCQLPPHSDPAQVLVEKRSVTSHPALEGFLRIRMTFVNRAGFAQPYPLLQVTFFRDDIKPAVQRTFRPSEYLDSAPATDAVLEVGQMVYVELDVEDPGADVTGFQFEFF